MMDKKLEKDILEIITQKQAYKTSFSELVGTFEEKLAKFDPARRAFELKDYFGGKNGHVGIRKHLLADNIIEEKWLRDYKTKKGKVKKDFKGLYVFLNGDIPFYVGISKGVIGRIQQHLKGHSHNQSTLAYNIGLVRYQLMKGETYSGGRKHFDFKADVSPAKEFLLGQRLALLPMESDEEMYLFEIYCAMSLQCYLNKFETH